MCIRPSVFRYTKCKDGWKNNLELTPTGTLTNFRENGDGEKVQNSIGFQAAYGIHSKADVRFRYERVWLANGSIVDDGIHTIGLAPKYSILENRIAASLLLGCAVDGAGDIGAFEIHPTMLFSVPLLNDKIDLNFSPKYLWSLDPDSENFMAFNLGLSASNDLKKWAIRPEYGLCFYLKKQEYFHNSASVFPINSLSLTKNNQY